MGFFKNGAAGVALLCAAGSIFSGPGSPIAGMVSGMGGPGVLLGGAVASGAAWLGMSAIEK